MNPEKPPASGDGPVSSGQDVHEKDTPILNDAGGYPLLQSMANELIDKLTPGVLIREQLTSLVAILESWSERNQPTTEEKHQLVDEMVLAIKDAQMFLTRKVE